MKKSDKRNNKFRKILFRFFFLIALLAVGAFFFLFPGCYIIQQVPGQLDMIFGQVDLEDAGDELKDKELLSLLSEVDQIVAFGVDHMKMQKSENYTTYYHVEGRGITYVVTAAYPLQMKAYEWEYPVVGKLPFRGYFDEENADEFAEELEKEESLDIYRFAAPAYSTLGWFKDPITTPMLRSGRKRLVDTLLHEMAHRTYYIKGKGNLNEQIASFVGKQGAEQYLLKYDPDYEKNKLADKTRNEKFTRFRELVLSYKEKLVDLYAQESPDSEKLAAKENILDELKSEAKKIYPNASDKYLTFNNARMLQFKRYSPDNPLVLNLWEEAGEDWNAFWKIIKTRYENN